MTVYLLRRGPQLLHEPLPRHWPCAIGLSHSPILVLPASEEVGGGMHTLQGAPECTCLCAGRCMHMVAPDTSLGARAKQ